MKGAIMEKLVILNSENAETNVNVIRYFKYKNDYFLIFSYDEIDESGKQKLYIVQILDELGEKIARNINDLDEWNNIQKMIKETIKQIKKGNDDNIEKLDFCELSNIKIEEPREFKVDPKLVKILSTNIVDDGLEGDNELMDKSQTSITNENMTEVLENEVNAINENVELVGSGEHIDKDTENNDNDIEDIDYKKMYFALKEDNDATEELLNDLMTKLSLYKEKYGELL